MKKTLVTTILLAGSLVVNAQGAFAENKSSATTTGSLTVTKPDAENPDDTVPVAPVDPNDPDTPFTPDEPNQGTAGLLTIDQAPDFDFGSIKLGTAKTVYAALQSGTDSSGASKEVQNFVQVTDKSGNYAGWKLSVKRTEFTGTTAETNKLTGSKVTFKNAVIRNSATNASGTPSRFQGAGTTGVEIPADQTVELVTAGANEGIGTWIYSLGADAQQGRESVELFIPVSNYAPDSYVSTFTWSLTDAPST
ncbi:MULTISPECIES: WxL domain-containing protein [unclassified Enterococcus]|uniref:WxL domain-containing protein n=1 Tax=unclassified Enterococcus TaxID=2608891 RepID=UPI0013EB6B2F|nr:MULTISPECIES: WxL domain-containing protein [unclassified Enterococcus]